jgi:hypothetical protein
MYTQAHMVASRDVNAMQTNDGSFDGSFHNGFGFYGRQVQAKS